MGAVGVVGLGAMGLPMARTLLAKGFAVSGFDVAAVRRAAFAGGVAELSDIARADTVLLSLPSDAVVRAVVEVLLARLASGAVIIDTSTVAPETTRALGQQAAARGIGYVDAPVSGGAAGAAAGSLLVMCGGTSEDVARARPVLEALARRVVACGGPGCGNVVKLANNLLVAGHLLLAREALALADANGVAAADLVDAVNSGSGRSAVSEVNLPRWVLSGTFDSAFTMGLMAKDVTLAEGLEGAGEISADVARRWREEALRLGPAADFNRIVLPPRDPEAP